jgi:hypothetical protein
LLFGVKIIITAKRIDLYFSPEKLALLSYLQLSSCTTLITFVARNQNVLASMRKKLWWVLMCFDEKHTDKN